MTSYTKMKIILSIILAIIISTMVYNKVKNLSDETTIVIAIQDIEERTFITADMLQEITVIKSEKDKMQPEAVTEINELKYAVSKTKIKSGQIIHRKDDVIAGTKQSLIDNKVLTKDGEINDAYFIKDNKRLMTIKLDLEGALNSDLKVGDYVDVIYTSEGKAENDFSIALLQHIMVFDVGKESNQYQNVTLEVTPQQSVDLAYAKRKGKIELVLNAAKGYNEIVYPVNTDKFLSTLEE